MTPAARKRRDAIARALSMADADWSCKTQGEPRDNLADWDSVTGHRADSHQYHKYCLEHRAQFRFLADALIAQFPELMAGVA